MVPPAWGCAVGLLPDMAHLMDKSGEDQRVGAAVKAVRVEGEFMDGTLVNAPAEALRGKVTVGLRVPLQGHQNLGQAAGKELPIEKVIGLLEGLICGDGNGCCLLHNCIVPYNFSFVYPIRMSNEANRLCYNSMIWVMRKSGK
jgi:hypothetical protein